MIIGFRWPLSTPTRAPMWEVHSWLDSLLIMFRSETTNETTRRKDPRPPVRLQWSHFSSGLKPLLNCALNTTARCGHVCLWWKFRTKFREIPRQCISLRPLTCIQWLTKASAVYAAVQRSLFLGFFISENKRKGKILMPINYPNIKAEWDGGTMASLWREPGVGGRVLASTRQLMGKSHIPCLTGSREKTFWISCIVPKPKTETKPWKQLKVCNWKPVSSVAHLVSTQQALQADFALSSHLWKQQWPLHWPDTREAVLITQELSGLFRWQTSHGCTWQD